MRPAPTKENTLYLPIKQIFFDQIFFDQIIEGSKKEEYRECKPGITMNRYLQKDPAEPSGYKINPENATPGQMYYWDDYNDGKYPFVPKPIKYLNLAVGYAKVRDTALVEVTGFHFTPEAIRYDKDGKPFCCYWVMAIELGEVVELHRK